MKILQINNFHYLKGGSETVYLETSKLLAEKGHDVSFMSTLNDKNSATEFSKYFIPKSDNLKTGLLKQILSVPSFIYSFKAANKLEKLIKKNKPDVAHLHIFYGSLTSSILKVLKKHKIPTVMTVHEYRLICPIYNFLTPQNKICEKCNKGHYYHCILKKCNKNNLLYSIVMAAECYFRDFFFNHQIYIDKFIMPSKFIQKKHIEHIPEISSKSIQIYNFIDFTNYHSRLIFGDYYLYFGRLSREKGIITLIDTFAHHKNLKLIIAGDGPLKEHLDKRIKDMNLVNIQTIGFISGEKLKDLISNSKFVIIPSEWYENNPLSIIESQALGKPVIGADIGGIPELIDDNKNGFIFESFNQNSLSEILEKAENLSKKDYQSYSQAARKKAESNYSSESYYKKLLHVYNSLILK